MSALEPLAELLAKLGVWCPTGDGEALRQAGATWRVVAATLEDAGAVLDAAARQVVENATGEAPRRFADTWASWSGTGGFIATTVADCRRLAAALVDFGDDTDNAERAIVALLETLLASVPAPPVVEPAPPAGVAPEAAALSRAAPGEVATMAAEAELVRARHAAAADVRCARIAELAMQGAPLGPDPMGVVGPTGQRARPVGRPQVECPALGAPEPGAVAWPSFGEPGDLTSLATTVVDFGAGQGRLPPDPSDPPTEPPDPYATAPWASGVSAQPTIVVIGDGNTVTIEAPEPMSFAPSALDSPAPTDLAGDESLAKFEPVAVAPLRESTPFDSTALDSTALDSTALDSVTYETAGFEATGLAPDPGWRGPTAIEPTAVTIDPPGGSPHGSLAGTAGGAVAGLAGGGLGAVGKGSAGARASMPFMPMMPMMGGMGGGADGEREPRRRRPRREEPPPPVV